MEVPKGYVLIKEEDHLHLLNELMISQEQIKTLSDQLAEIKKSLHKDSHNSHKPPSTDGYKKKAIKNNRQRGGKNPGAQKSHKGKTLQMSDTPDKIEVKKVEGKCDCGRSLKNVSEIGFNRRQVIDLVEKWTEITEYHIEMKQCSCGQIHYGEADKYVAVQYGKRIRAMATYLNQYQFIPFDRTQEMFKDWFGISISDGCIQAANERCYEHTSASEAQIKEKIKSAPVINNDETGIRCEGKLQWIHTSSTEEYTHYTLHEKRGTEAINDIGILTDYQGTSVHDRLSAYDTYLNCKHGYCNGHIIRDLKYICEEDKRLWAGKMIDVLIQAKELKDENELDEKNLKYINRKYDLVLKSGLEAEPPPKRKPKGQRGRQKKSKSLRLLEVFQNSKDKVLRFVYDPSVPFDNNLAERDLRMVKLKQKISGTFRTKKGGQMFCRIRGYISTVRKLGYNVMEALQMAIDGNPINFSAI